MKRLALTMGHAEAMTDSLVEWLTAILDEDERTAREVEIGVGRHRAGEPFEDGSGIASSDAYPSYPWGQSEVELEFMARHDPRSVLADIAAKRQIVRLHAFYGPRQDERDVCGRNATSWPCYTLRALASAYARRDGYRQEWAPQ